MQRLAIGLLLMGLGACGDSNPLPASEPLSAEDGPAPPCSVNAMISRDTESRDFVRCPESDFPLIGESADCLDGAAAKARPFVLPIETARPVPAAMQPALVGAVFDGEYRLRMYMGTRPGQGERSEMEMTVTGPEPVSMMPMTTTKRLPLCRVSTKAPAADAPRWETIDAQQGHRFDPKACVEDFDATVWDAKPFDSKYDAKRVLKCKD